MSDTSVQSPSCARTDWFRDFFLIFLVAAALRLALFAAALPYPERFQEPDTATYYLPAINLLHHFSFSKSPEAPFLPEEFRTPGYPAFAALVFAVLPERHASVVFVQCLLSAFACCLLYGVARSWWGRKMGLLVGLAQALSMSGVVNSLYFLSDGLYSILVILQIVLWARYLQTHALRWVCLASACLGLMTLTRPIGMMWIIPQIFLLLTEPGQPWKRRLIATVVGLLIFQACIIPWKLHNAHVGIGYTLCTAAGSTLYLNNVVASEAARTNTSGDILRAQWGQELEQIFARERQRFATPQARCDYQVQRSLEIMKAHPLAYAKAHLKPWALLPNVNGVFQLLGIAGGQRGTLDILTRQGVVAAANHYLDGRWWLLLLMLPWIALQGAAYALATCGCVLLFKRRLWWEIMAFLAFSYYYIFMVGPVTLARYQEPAMPAIFLLAAWALLQLRQSYRNRS
ncbi:TPA: hypothetical protein DDW35_03180 [Candidatus Sumerlaeota bacterium]|nr:hypothetical protein [Candidatus Sumerlaeota bacterium]